MEKSELDEARDSIAEATGPITITLPKQNWETFKRTATKKPGVQFYPGTIVHLTDGGFFAAAYIYTDELKWRQLDVLATP